MKFSKIIIAASVIFLSQLSTAASETTGDELFKTYCEACHGLTGGMDMSKRIAPPMVAVKMHYKNKLSDKAAFVAAMVDWLAQPDESKSRMRGAIKRFNLMPPIVIDEEDARKIATYVYETDLEKPEGFDDHEAEMKGNKKGMGMGKGKGKQK